MQRAASSAWARIGAAFPVSRGIRSFGCLRSIALSRPSRSALRARFVLIPPGWTIVTATFEFRMELA